jgi:hypothetical protein
VLKVCIQHVSKLNICTVKESKIARNINIKSHNMTQPHQYRPNMFNPSDKLLDNISMDEMVDGFNGLQQCRLL